eukprot:TRINITY_DN31161_c0_g1_i1.p1 TRINITY_DN31161_c0_g1~~TRINITY_DN31161_c0_g1_i1.p1  ORF type:complete len:159 (-),score=36.08 TRINITY_DN31161_c0_g1_i1:588-1064(-)
MATLASSSLRLLAPTQCASIPSSLPSRRLSLTSVRVGNARQVAPSCVAERKEFFGVSTVVSGSFASLFLQGESEGLSVPCLEEAAPAGVQMAVPKKKTSRTKTKKRKATWKAKGRVAALKAYGLAKMVLSGKANFIYPPEEKEKRERERLEAEAETTA